MMLRSTPMIPAHLLNVILADLKQLRESRQPSEATANPQALLRLLPFEATRKHVPSRVT